MAGLDISYLAAAGAGALSFLSPCVLPLVPAFIGYVAGVSFEETIKAPATGSSSSRKLTIAALFFVLGFSTVFVLLGASASAVHGLILDHIELLSKIAGALIVVFGLHFMGVLRLKVLDRELRFHPKLRPTGPTGAYAIGLAFGFGWTPCVGPILATILTLAASRESLGYGVSLLATYAAGLGVPFLIAAAAMQPFLSFFSRFRRHLRKIEVATGVFLVATGVLIFTNALGQISFYLLELFPVLGEIG
jgi:cytochrome c-type biogenesis protein